MRAALFLKAPSGSPGDKRIDLTGFRHNGSHLCFQAELPGVTPRKFRMRFVASGGRMMAKLIAKGSSAEAEIQKNEFARRAVGTV